MSGFQVSSVRDGDELVVALAGEFDLHGRDELQAALVSAVEVAPQVLVDLADVRFLDSSGLHALVAAHQLAKERGRSLYVANATGTVATILEITGIIKLLRPPSDGPRTRG
jgi:anti-sigma B factor antagonist